MGGRPNQPSVLRDPGPEPQGQDGHQEQDHHRHPGVHPQPVVGGEEHRQHQQGQEEGGHRHQQAGPQTPGTEGGLGDEVGRQGHHKPHQGHEEGKGIPALDDLRLGDGEGRGVLIPLPCLIKAGQGDDHGGHLQGDQQEAHHQGAGAFQDHQQGGEDGQVQHQPGQAVLFADGEAGFPKQSLHDTSPFT